MPLSDYRMPLNISNSDEITTKELGEEIALLTGVECKPTCQALPENDSMQRKFAIAKARKVLGRKLKVDHAEGLRRTPGYFKEHVK